MQSEHKPWQLPDIAFLGHHPVRRVEGRLHPVMIAVFGQIVFDQIAVRLAVGIGEQRRGASAGPGR